MEKSIFDTVWIGNMKCRNRIMRSATWEALADEKGFVSKKQAEIYHSLACGEIGLICTGYARVDAEDCPNAGMMGIYDDTLVEQYLPLTESVHKQGGKIMMQIAYGGTKTTYRIGERSIFAPSDVPERSTGTVGTVMDRNDIRQLTLEYALAAERVKKAGFDALELHAGHSYLLNQFLSPYYNCRTDEYGGSIENRYRFLDEIIKAAREKVGPDYPIAVKITCSDFFDGGFSFTEAKSVALLLERSGVDMIEVSGNIHGKAQKMIGTEFDGHKIMDGGYFRDYAKEIAGLISIPVYATGGFCDINEMNEDLNDSNLSGFGMSRPFLCEPNLLRRWRSGDLRKAKCLHCSRCRTPEGNYCTVFS